MANANLIHEDVGQLLHEAGCTDEFTRQFLTVMQTEDVKTCFACYGASGAVSWTGCTKKKRNWTNWTICAMRWKSSSRQTQNRPEGGTDMRRIFLAILVMAALLTLTACGTMPNSGAASTNESSALPPAQQEESSMVPDTSDVMADTALEEPFSETAITITVSGQTFSAALLNNETARQLVEQFPLTLNMSELNGNEKYFCGGSFCPRPCGQHSLPCPTP